MLTLLDGMLRVVVPEADGDNLFNEAHTGTFRGYLRGGKIHNQLKMRANVEKWCHGCLVFATRYVGQKAVPPLTPLPVGGLFDRAETDVVQLLKSSSEK